MMILSTEFKMVVWSVEDILGPDPEKDDVMGIIDLLPEEAPQKTLEERMAERNTFRGADGKDPVATGKAKPINRPFSTKKPSDDQLAGMPEGIKSGIEANASKFEFLKKNSDEAESSEYKKLVMSVDSCKAIFVNGIWYIVRDTGVHETAPKVYGQSLIDEATAWHEAAVSMGRVPVKAIIAGSRHITDYEEVVKAIESSGFQISEVVSGCAAGPDTTGATWARNNGIPVKDFPADWDNTKVPGAVIKINKHGKPYNAKAGHDRNQQMADYVGGEGVLICVWDGKSTGSKDMISRAEAKGLKVYIHPYLG